MNSGKGRFARIGVVALTVVLSTVALFLIFGERFLRVENDHHQVHADAVVVLAGIPLTEDSHRIREGSELYHQGRGRFLILPLRHNTFKWSWAVDNYKLKRPIPGSRLLIGRETPQNEQAIARFGGTYVEAQNSVAIMQRHRIKSAIIVSSAYHMRRAEIAFEQCKKGHDLQFYYHPVDRTNESGLPWWTDPRYVYRVLSEYVKLLAAYFIYSR